MKEPDLEEEALRATARGDRRHDRAPDAWPTRSSRSTLTAPSGATQTATLAGASPGLWQRHRRGQGGRPATASTTASSPPSSASARRIRANTRRCSPTRRTLAPLAEATGGSVRRVADEPDDTPRVPSIVALAAAPLRRRRLHRHPQHRLVVVRGVGVTAASSSASSASSCSRRACSPPGSAKPRLGRANRRSRRP